MRNMFFDKQPSKATQTTECILEVDVQTTLVYKNQYKSRTYKELNQRKYRIEEKKFLAKTFCVVQKN